MTLKDFLDKIMVVYVCPARVSDHLILGENYFNSKNVQNFPKFDQYCEKILNRNHVSVVSVTQHGDSPDGLAK